MKDMMLAHLNTACRWISDRAADYGVTSEFICDWNENADIKYNVIYESEMLVSDASRYRIVANDILKNLNVNMILSEYEAEDIVYLFFYNTDFDNEVHANSLTHVDSPDFDIEYATIPVRANGEVTSPATIAHEILHFFGAYDLYEVEDNKIPDEYIAYLAENGSDDIMRFVNSEDEIYASFSLLDAYYTGLADECPDVSEWGLPEAERFTIDK